MSQRSAPLTVVKGGITRLRTKGAALNDSLYDLLNGYVTVAKTVVIRPGTARVATLPEGTKGLCAFDDSLHVFASEILDVPAGFVLHVISHPNANGSVDSAGDPDTLTEIHFAAPFMGFLYVVAEFADGDIYHYWLQTVGAWAADTVYHNGDLVIPTTPNGIAYRATRLTAPLPSWAPDVLRTVGDQVEPTTYNDFYYTVVDTAGANPVSGDTEPAWPTEDGQQVIEDTDGSLPSATTVTTPSSTQLPEDVTDRYGNPYA